MIFQRSLPKFITLPQVVQLLSIFTSFVLTVNGLHGSPQRPTFLWECIARQSQGYKAATLHPVLSHGEEQTVYFLTQKALHLHVHFKFLRVYRLHVSLMISKMSNTTEIITKSKRWHHLFWYRYANVCQRYITWFSLFIDREAGEIIRLVASVCPSVCPWMLSQLNGLTHDLDFWHEGWPWPWLVWDCRSRS